MYTELYQSILQCTKYISYPVCVLHACMHALMHTHTTHARTHTHTHTHAQTHKHEHAYIHTPHNTRARTHQLLSLNLLSPNKSGDKLLLSNFW